MKYLIQMAGFPATGKSTFSKILAKKIDGVIIDRDIIKNAMLKVGIEGMNLNKGSYKVVFDLAEFYLNEGLNVILDTPCFYEEILEQGLEICAKTDTNYKFIECVVEDYGVIKERLKKRNHLATQINEVAENIYYRDYRKSIKPKNNHFIVVDTMDMTCINWDSIMAYIDDNE